MKFNAEGWKATFLRVHEKTPNLAPCNGDKTAIASLIYVRDGLLGEITDEDAKAEVKLAFAELIGSIAESKLGGFACNASAAAAMAGIKVAGKDKPAIDIEGL